MKVCVISNYYRPWQKGGGQDVAVATAEALRDFGEEVVVITMCPYAGFKSLWPKASREGNIKIYRWYPLNLYFLAEANRQNFAWRLLWTFLDIFNFFAWLAVRSILKKEKPDWIISHGTKGLGGFIYRLCGKFTPNYTHVLHDVLLLEPSGLVFPETINHDLNKPGHRIYQYLARWQTSTIPLVIAPSHWLLNLHITMGFFKYAETAVVLNPMLTKVVPKKDHSGFNVIFLGQLEKHKGVEVLLAAWSQVALADKKLTIIGNGQSQEAVKQVAAQDGSINLLEFEYWLDKKIQDEVWATADLVVVPSTCLENSPSVIYQALSQGLPVIASQVGGIPELANHSSLLKLVAPNRPTDLGEAINLSIKQSPPSPSRPDFLPPSGYVAKLKSLIGS
jgi:glycosyltransferase involved in cell wall biosynthesis